MSKLTIASILIALVVGVQGKCKQPGPKPELVECLAKIGTQPDQLIPRGAPSYANATFRWNDYVKREYPAAVIYPSNVEQVEAIVKCADKFGTTISVKSVGHSYEGFWQGLTGGVLIDLKGMTKVEVDTKSKLVKVQAGALLGKIMGELWDKDRGALPHGLQAMIGIGGHTLGGGFGLLSRKHGLLVDTVVEMEMVSAQGKKLTVNEKENKDLFFALRGAGAGSYGVVTEFTFKYVNPPEKLTVARLNWVTNEKNFTGVVDQVMDYYSSNPDYGATHYLNLGVGGKIELGVTFSNEKMEDQRAALKKMESFFVSKGYGAEKKYTISTSEDDFIQSFLNFAGLAGTRAEMDVKDLSSTGPYSTTSFYKGRSGYIAKRLSKEKIAGLSDILFKANPKAGFFLLIDLYEGKIRDNGNDKNFPESSFSHRNVFASCQIGATDKEAGLSVANSIYKLLKPDFPEAYQNYIDIEEKNYLEVYYGNYTKRLIDVKKSRDPKNLLKFAMSIPLEYPSYLKGSSNKGSYGRP